ncbi:hypothetical protein FALBO_13730 [Fusarium albosuccineum]|uniref:Uncharacterized protein n=1 Tax=Fusarium albosuccineum TaxID=1237068 RepID=A0A8H4PG55_9HYPO|nr:hypothetical protein FALBO_13730 [Fusarium albosuccineum]
MRAPSFLTLAALALTANAEFWVVKSTLGTSIPGPVDPENGNWQWILPADIRDCESAKHANLYNARSDVSGDKHGVRVKFGKQEGLFDQLQPLEVEWNAWSGRHETWYANRGGAYVNLEDHEVGHCVEDFSVNDECDLPAFGKMSFQSMLRCDGDAP